MPPFLALNQISLVFTFYVLRPAPSLLVTMRLSPSLSKPQWPILRSFINSPANINNNVVLVIGYWTTAASNVSFEFSFLLSFIIHSLWKVQVPILEYFDTFSPLSPLDISSLDTGMYPERVWWSDSPIMSRKQAINPTSRSRGQLIAAWKNNTSVSYLIKEKIMAL